LHAVSIVTLTTDFGLDDHYLGVMKGVILSLLVCREVKAIFDFRERQIARRCGGR